MKRIVIPALCAALFICTAALAGCKDTPLSRQPEGGAPSAPREEETPDPAEAGGAADEAAIAYGDTTIFNLTSMTGENADIAEMCGKAIADLLARRDGSAPEELWLCGLWTIYDSGMEWCALARHEFDGETTPELYRIRNGKVIAATQQSDPFYVNYADIDRALLLYGESFAFDGGPVPCKEIAVTVSSDEGGRAVGTAQIETSIDEVRRRLEGSAHAEWAREYFMLGCDSSATLESISMTTADGKPFPKEKYDTQPNIFLKEELVPAEE